MIILIKTEKETRIMAEGGRKLAEILSQVFASLKPGVKLLDLDQLTEQLIKKAGGKPNFKMVPGYHWTTCINVNEGVVHGVPNDYRVKSGDVVSIDLGMIYQGLHTDMARTMIVQSVRGKAQEGGKEEFLRAGKETLIKAVKAAKAGHRVGHISEAIEKGLKKAGLYPVKSLTGHGIGKNLHEPPSIPCFLKGEISDSPLLEKGMVLAIEVIYTQGKTDLYVEKDGWTVKTKSGALGGLFEDMVLVSLKGSKILTQP